MLAVPRWFALVLGLGWSLAGPIFAAENPPGLVEATAEAKVPWAARLKEWRRWMSVDTKDAAKMPDAAREALGAIDDPEAIPALVSAVKSEKNALIRRALIQPLIKLGGKDAVALLVKLSVEDDDAMLREQAAVGLVGKQELAEHLDRYIKYLGTPRYATQAAQALRWNKLAQPVSTVEQPDPKLAQALINALVQKVKKRVPYKYAFDTGVLADRGIHDGDGFFRHYGTAEGWIDVPVPVPNEAVLLTLQYYLEQNYGYDKQKWSSYLSSRK
jgi:hypothetical protein